MTRHDDGTEQGKFDGPSIAGSVSLAKSNLQAAAVLLSISENSIARVFCAKALLDSIKAAKGAGVEFNDVGGDLLSDSGTALESAYLRISARLAEHERLGLESRWYRGVMNWRRNLAVVAVTGLVLGGFYRKNHGQSLNLWSNELTTGDVAIRDHHQGWGELQINRTVDKGPIQVNGIYFAKGIGTHAESVINVDITSSGKKLTGGCGYPDYVSSAGIVCSIEVGDRKLFESVVLDGSHRLHNFEIDLEGAKSVVLKVVSAGEDINAAHAVWIDLAVKD